VRRLYEAGYNEENVMNLFRFIDWVLKLPKALEAEFWQELQVYEESRKMPYITSVEKIGFERGQKEGREEGKLSLLAQQLTWKFGPLPERTLDRITSLPTSQIESLAKALLSFTTIDDVIQWLDHQ
jgi:predicted transposase YdaD